jgi:hypothetical protein
MTARPAPFAAPVAPPTVEQAAPDAPAPGASGAQPDLAAWLSDALGTLTRANEALRGGIIEAKYEIARLRHENDRLRSELDQARRPLGEALARRSHPSNRGRLGDLRVVDGGGL